MTSTDSGKSNSSCIYGLIQSRVVSMMGLRKGLKCPRDNRISSPSYRVVLVIVIEE